MEKKKICIVSTNKEFEAVYYEPNNRPLNYVLELPNYGSKNNKFLLINTGIEVSWLQHESWRYDGGHNVLKATHNDVTLLHHFNVTQPQVVIDVLNKFNTISKSELKLLISKIQEEEKNRV